MNKYYINDRQVSYSIFHYELLKICKFIVLMNTETDLTEIKLIKRAKDLYFDYYDKLKNQGVTLELNKLAFKVRQY